LANPSNWGRWGAEDERGTLNLLTPELVRAAAGLVKTGRVYSLGLDLSKDAPVSAGRNQLWHRATRSDRPPPSHSGADDIVVMHTHTATHVLAQVTDVLVPELVVEARRPVAPADGRASTRSATSTTTGSSTTASRPTR
jgi:hypothetical protein